MLVLLLVLAGSTLPGCTRIRAALAVSTQDQVAGEIVIAGPTAPTGGQAAASAVPGPDEIRERVPDDLAGQVRVQPYALEGYEGSQLFFDDLTLAELQELTGALAAEQPEAAGIALSRTGSLLTLTGSSDLTGLAPDSDVQLRIAFPALISTTTGAQESSTAVGWTLPPGQVTEIGAVVRSADPAARPWQEWVLLVGAATGGAALLVVVLAGVAVRRTRRREAEWAG